MKNLLFLMVVLTSVSSFSRPRISREECSGDQYSSVTSLQVQNAAKNLIDSAQSVPDQQQAILRLGLISGKSNPGEMSNEQYYALVALSGRSLVIQDVLDNSCPIEYSNLHNLFVNSQQIVESIKKQLSGK